VAEISEKFYVYYDWQFPNNKPNPPGPAWLRKLLGEDFFSSVETVRAKYHITDEWLSRLEPLTDLKSFDLESCTDITDEGLLCLKKFKRLNAVMLYRTGVTDAGLEHIRGLTELRRLVLANTVVGDAGLANVKDLKKLEDLNLCQTGVTDASLTLLKGLSKLTYFNAIDTGMTESGIADLQKALPNCKIYWGQSGKEATDDGLRPLLRASQKTISDYDKAISLDPTNPLLYINRGLTWQTMNHYDKALADFDEGIRLDPTNASYYIKRAIVWYAKDQLDKALADFEESVTLDPQNARANAEAIHPFWPSFAYLSRAAAWEAKGKFDKALDDYGEAIAQNSEYFILRAFLGRAGVWEAKGDFSKAMDDYEKAIELEPDNPDGYKGRAWIRATCPNDKYRDGAKAIEEATQACELSEWEDENILDTLAAAYAEAGQFDKAIDWQQKAIDTLAAYAEDEDYQIDKAVELQRTKGFQVRLKLYQEGKPYRVERK